MSRERDFFMKWMKPYLTGWTLTEAPLNVGGWSHTYDVTGRLYLGWKGPIQKMEEKLEEAEAAEEKSAFLIDYLLDALGAASDDIWAMANEAWEEENEKEPT